MPWVWQPEPEAHLHFPHVHAWLTRRGSRWKVEIYCEYWCICEWEVSQRQARLIMRRLHALTTEHPTDTGAFD
jgi:hypothetical protein